MPDHKTIHQQELWDFFEGQAEHELVTAVKSVCEQGLQLTKDIIRFFPNFTLHDETHSANVCRWMWRLLGDRAGELSVNEAALLLMAACCHDIGMAVSPAQEAQLRQRTYRGWDEYFRKDLSDAEEFDRTKTISDRMLRNFVRQRHHERVRENLASLPWPQELTRRGIRQDTLVALCQSHGQPLDRNKLKNTAGKQDLLLCAVLLRLSDMLDYDMVRAPEAIFRFHGLEAPRNEEEARSAQEYLQNRAGNFDEVIADHVLGYNAVFEHPRQEQAVMDYLDWVKQELDHCGEELRQTASKWQSLQLPYRIDTENVERIGYEAGDFSMTMDQDRVIDLLVGENLYSDPGVFVRELLQNSIDAVYMRAKQDKGFSLEDGLIQIDSWRDGATGDTWFRIRDNGTGMNRKIIKDHFLKVGNSYYTSEDFRHANRHAAKGSYTAISRFGIGILSCFMCDKERTELKVSTKRFPAGRQNGLRLDVTGLHGRYFLSNEEKHFDYVEGFRPMPSPDDHDRGYRQEPGTTICVRTSMIRMGETRSFREILDEYVKFPEVRVTYNGPEGYHEYLKQQELMEAVYALNPDGKIREYVYEIPDEDFERVQQGFPYHIFEERPRVILRYEPLDRLSDSEKLTGVQIWAEAVKPKVRIREVEDQELREVLKGSRMGARIESIHETGVRIRFDLNGVPLGILKWKIAPMGDVSVNLVKGEPSLQLSPEENRLWELCFGAIRGSKAKRRLIAYNGVLAQTDQDASYLRENICFVMLLREEFLPRVNMARNEITGIPTEAACCMAMAGLEKDVPGNRWRLATERELWAILDRHPIWAEMLLAEKSRGIWGSSPRTALWLAHWKRQCRVSFRRQERTLYADTGGTPDGRTADFPAAMFCELDGDVLFRTRFYNVYYDPSHPFSRWLIEHRAALVEQVPNLYDTMIKTMMLTDEAKKIREVLNTSLELLRKMEGNPFQVPADLILTEKDFE